MQQGNYSALHLRQIPRLDLKFLCITPFWSHWWCLWNDHKDTQEWATGKNNTFWRINISLSFGQTPQEPNSDKIWALIHRLLVQSSRICTQGPSSSKSQQPEVCGAQRGVMSAETSPCPPTTPKPVGDVVLQGGDPSQHPDCEAQLPGWGWDHGWWAAALASISLTGFSPLQCLSQPPSAKSQQKAWLFAPECLLSLFVQEMGNS